MYVRARRARGGAIAFKQFEGRPVFGMNVARSRLAYLHGMHARLREKCAAGSA